MIKFGSGIDLLIPKTVPGGALVSVLGWGGMVLAGFLVSKARQQMIHTAEDQTQAFDPTHYSVNALLGLYIGTLALFVFITC